jgi:hypothetical protein
MNDAEWPVAANRSLRLRWFDVPIAHKFPPMKLSKKAEYALRALVAMGREREGTNFSIQDLASKERIPLKFLEQILLALKNGGMLRSKRGVGGGYQLVVDPAHVQKPQCSLFP